MELYPAIDLRAGRVVRLVRGDFGQETVYGTEPVQRALAFEAGGAKWLHVVDLDAFTTGAPGNRAVVAAVACAVKARVQAGGGVRGAADVEELLSAGVARVLMGTAALAHPEVFAELTRRWPGRVGAAVDHYEGEVRVKGWSERSGRGVAEVVAEMAEAGAAVVIITEISRDGLMTGPDLHGYKALLEAVDVPLIASGGVSSLDDLRRLAWLQAGSRRLAGVIVGRALYEGRFSVQDALASLRAPAGGRAETSGQ